LERRKNGALARQQEAGWLLRMQQPQKDAIEADCFGWCGWSHSPPSMPARVLRAQQAGARSVGEAAAARPFSLGGMAWHGNCWEGCAGRAAAHCHPFNTKTEGTP
jgi:hypothetical protein